MIEKNARIITREEQTAQPLARRPVATMAEEPLARLTTCARHFKSESVVRLKRDTTYAHSRSPFRACNVSPR